MQECKINIHLQYSNLQFEKIYIIYTNVHVSI